MNSYADNVDPILQKVKENEKRVKKGLKAIPLRTYEEWSNV